MTKLEQLALEKLSLKFLNELNSKDSEQQNRLDEATPGIMKQLNTGEVLEHTTEIYNATAEEYANNPQHQPVIDELLEFMWRLPESSRVIDVGCGTGRDMAFMASPDFEYRTSLMRKTCPYQVPTHAFSVIGLDSSNFMISYTMKRLRDLATHRYSPQFLLNDMHLMLVNLSKAPVKQFDGIWSCAALFTHTPETLVRAVIDSISRILKPGGVFSVSYTCGNTHSPYDKLLISSTGRIKYFSHPQPERIAAEAEKHGLCLYRLTFDDYSGKKDAKRLFASQLFKKA